MEGMPPLLNEERIALATRRAERRRVPTAQQARVVSVYDTNTYLCDYAARRVESRAAQGQEGDGGDGAKWRRAPRVVSALSRLQRSSRRSSKRSSEAPKQRHPCTCDGDNAPSAAPAKVPRLADTQNQKRKGFNRAFIDLALGMSFFTVDKVAYIAANDFLKSPTLMVTCYLEWAAACERLATSGQLSTAASELLLELAEMLTLTPAACLDYFDAIYLRDDLDGEHAGFSPSGHLLRNESIFSELDAEFDHLPLLLTRPLAPIQVALKHDLKEFLAQPVVNSFMRSEWVGGGIAELLQGDIWELRRTGLFAVVGLPLYLPYNLVILSIVAVVPSFEQWYVRYLGFQQMQTHERVFRGLCFIPAFKYATCAPRAFSNLQPSIERPLVRDTAMWLTCVAEWRGTQRCGCWRRVYLVSLQPARPSTRQERARRRFDRDTLHAAPNAAVPRRVGRACLRERRAVDVRPRLHVHLHGGRVDRGADDRVHHHLHGARARQEVGRRPRLHGEPQRCHFRPWLQHDICHKQHRLIQLLRVQRRPDCAWPLAHVDHVGLW